jgi:hypothetical protein
MCCQRFYSFVIVIECTVFSLVGTQMEWVATAQFLKFWPVLILHFSLISQWVTHLQFGSFFYGQCTTHSDMADVFCHVHHNSLKKCVILVQLFIFVGKIFGWSWWKNCGPSTSPSLLTARTRIRAPLRPFSVKNGVQRTIATCGHVLWQLMPSVPSQRLGSTIKRISQQSAEGKYHNTCQLEILVWSTLVVFNRGEQCQVSVLSWIHECWFLSHRILRC